MGTSGIQVKIVFKKWYH